MTQELYELPEGWEWIEFYKLVDNLDARRIPIKTSERSKENAIYPYYGATGIIDYVDEYIFEGENLLISEDGANLVARKYPIAFLADGKYWVNNHAHVVSAISDKVSNQYLVYFFAVLDLSSFITGSAQPKLSQKKLNEIKVAVAPLLEQQRLVKKLDALLSRIDTAIEHLEHSLELNDQLFASSLNQAFNPLDAKIQSDGTYQLPEGWEWKKLSKISSFFNGYAFKKNQYSENGMPLLRITNIQNGEVVKNNQIFIDLDKTEKKAHEFVVNPSDIVIAMSGATTGKVAINHTSTVFLQNQRVGRFVIPDLNLRDFVFYFLAHIAEENLNKAFGAAQPNLSTAQINSINVPLPNSSNLEKVITTIKALAKATKTNKQALQKKLEQLQQLKASLLDSAFRGEL